MAPLMNGEKTIRKKATLAVVSVTDSRAGRKRRNPGAGEAGSCHADRSGLVVTSSPPPKSIRCDGLSRASRSTSMPKISCHAMSNSPPTANTATPASPSP